MFAYNVLTSNGAYLILGGKYIQLSPIWKNYIFSGITPSILENFFFFCDLLYFKNISIILPGLSSFNVKGNSLVEREYPLMLDKSVI